jgi:hypothetical protein
MLEKLLSYVKYLYIFLKFENFFALNIECRTDNFTSLWCQCINSSSSSFFFFFFFCFGNFLFFKLGIFLIYIS